jgi:hypothetical protein
MKVTEIFESPQLTEKPMGLLKTAGLGVASALGSQSSKEKLEVGGRANYLRQKFNTYLNTSGQQATADALLTFLKQVGYPTDAASKIVKSTPAGKDQPAADQTASAGKSQQQPAQGQQPQQQQPAATGKNFDTKTGAPLTASGKAKVAFDSDPEVKKAMNDFKNKKIDAGQWQDKMKQLRAKHGVTEKPTQTTPAAGQQPQQQPAQGQQQQQTKQQKQPAANKADTDSYEKFKGQIRQVQSGSDPLPGKMIAGVEADIAKLGKGDKESGSFAAQKILKFAKAGYDVSSLSSKWLANSKAGERFLTQSVFIAISKMLQEHGLYWSDLGIKLRLDESVSGGVYISLMEQAALDDKVIDQALTAAVQDAFKTGMLQIGPDGKVQVGKSSQFSKGAGSASTRQGTLGNQSPQASSLDEIKDLINQLDDNDKKQVVDFLEKG